MRTIDTSRYVRRYLGIAERTLLGLGMSLIIFVVERQMHRRARRARAT